MLAKLVLSADQLAHLCHTYQQLCQILKANSNSKKHRDITYYRHRDGTTFASSKAAILWRGVTGPIRQLVELVEAVHRKYRANNSIYCHVCDHLRSSAYCMHTLLHCPLDIPCVVKAEAIMPPKIVSCVNRPALSVKLQCQHPQCFQRPSLQPQKGCELCSALTNHPQPSALALRQSPDTGRPSRKAGTQAQSGLNRLIPTTTGVRSCEEPPLALCHNATGDAATTGGSDLCYSQHQQNDSAQWRQVPAHWCTKAAVQASDLGAVGDLCIAKDADDAGANVEALVLAHGLVNAGSIDDLAVAPDARVLVYDGVADDAVLADADGDAAGRHQRAPLLLALVVVRADDHGVLHSRHHALKRCVPRITSLQKQPTSTELDNANTSGLSVIGLW